MQQYVAPEEVVPKMFFAVFDMWDDNNSAWEIYFSENQAKRARISSPHILGFIMVSGAQDLLGHLKSCYYVLLLLVLLD